MKSLTGYLEEKIQWQQSLSTMLFDIGSHIDNLKFPMSSSIFKRIWPDSIRATVFHVTGPDDFAKVEKLQGKKSSISAFFEMSTHYLESGIQTKGGVVVELDANILVSVATDAMSSPDKSGRRWVDLSYLSRETSADFGVVEIDLEKLLEQLITTYMPGKLKSMSRKKLPTEWSNLGYKIKDDKMAMRDLIKDYIDGIEVILKKHQQLFKDRFYRYVQTRTTDRSWDEQVVNNFKIKKVHLISDARVWSNPQVGIKIKDFVSGLKGMKVQRWKDADSLGIYIKDVAKTERGRDWGFGEKK